MSEQTKTPLPPNYRDCFEVAMASMFSNPTYSQDYLFYAHVIGQMRVYFDTGMQAPAGMNFMHDHYCLYINPLEEITLQPDKDGNYPKDKNGKEIKSMPGFAGFDVPTRLGILKHEALHMLHHHIGRRQDRNHEGFNIAADCAINQQITRAHLPKGGIFPDQFPSKDGNPVPENLTAEQYYELLKFDENGNQNGGGGQGPSGIDDHSKWDESQGDMELAEDIAKSNLEKAIAQTQKSRGNLPSNISELLDSLTKKREVDWKRVFKRLAGNKKAHTRKTLMRPDRRFPTLNWIKGRTKNRVGVPCIVGDESGSVSNEELISAIGECLHICKTLNTDLWYVPVDSRAHKPHILKSNQRSFKRSACGGTVLAPALKMIEDQHIPVSALVIITDNYIDDSDIEAFTSTGKPVIWLITSDGSDPKPSQMQGKSKAFKLKPRAD